MIVCVDGRSNLSLTLPLGDHNFEETAGAQANTTTGATWDETCVPVAHVRNSESQRGQLIPGGIATTDWGQV